MFFALLVCLHALGLFAVCLAVSAGNEGGNFCFYVIVAVFVLLACAGLDGYVVMRYLFLS